MSLLLLDGDDEDSSPLTAVEITDQIGITDDVLQQDTVGPSVWPQLSPGMIPIR